MQQKLIADVGALKKELADARKDAAHYEHCMEQWRALAEERLAEIDRLRLKCAKLKELVTL